MSLRSCTPCDYDGICPYDAEYYHTCEYWCGADEPEDYPEDDDEYDYDDLLDTLALEQYSPRILAKDPLMR